MSTFDYEWLRSSFCASGACVLVALGDDGYVLVSDSKHPEKLPLAFTSGNWRRALDDIIRDGLPDGAYWMPGGVNWGRFDFTAEEWDAFERDVKAGEFDYDRLCTRGVEAGPGAGVSRSGQAATGAGDGGATSGVPAPVAAQPRYVLDAPAILELVERYGEAERDAADSFMRPAQKMAARDEADNLLRAIRVALTPVPASEPEPAWGSGPLVPEYNPDGLRTQRELDADLYENYVANTESRPQAEADAPLVEHNPSSDADTELPYLTGQPVSFVDDGDGQATRS